MTTLNGQATNVYIGDAGAELAADVALNDTSITVDQPYMFNEAGGGLELNDVPLTYTDANMDTGVLTLSAPSPVVGEVGDAVYVLPRGSTKWALVYLEDEDEGARARVPLSLYDRLTDGIREYDDEESVYISDAKGYWEVTGVEEEIPNVDGSYIDPETLPPAEVATDNLPPSTAPVVTALDGMDMIFLSWPAVSNPDPVTYDVYASQVSPVAISAGNLIGSTDATVFNHTLATGVWFIKVVARDDDGSGPASTEVSAEVFAPVDEAALQAQIDANETAVQARPRVIFAAEQPTGLTAEERVTWYDTDNGYAASYWDGTAWGPYSLGTGAFQVGSITGPLLADLAVTAAKVASSSITTTKIAADAVTAGELASAAVGSSELAAGAVIAGKIAAGTIQAGDIAAGAVVAGKIAAGAVTTTELAADAVTAAKILAGTITAAEIAADTITANKIAANAITVSELAADSVVSAKIAANTIVAADIATDTITAAQIAANTITATQIAAGTITAVQIAGATITGNKIVAGTITASLIAANSITATQIAAGAITASELSATAIDGKTITGALIRTLSSGQRVEISDTAAGDIRFYNASNVKTAWIDATSIGFDILTSDGGELSMGNNGTAYFGCTGQLQLEGWSNGVYIHGTGPGYSLQVGYSMTVGAGGINSPYIYSNNMRGQSGASIAFGGHKLTGVGGVTLSGGETINSTNPPSASTIPNARWVSGTGAGGNLLWTSHANSSIRYKKNLKDLAKEVSAATILGISAHSYDWREDAPGWHEGMGRQAGFVAEDIERAGLEKWLGYDDDGLPNEVDYAKWTILLQLVAQQQDRRIKALEDKMERVR